MGLRGTRKQGSGENCLMSSLMAVLITHYCSVDQIAKNEIGGACSTYGERIGLYGVLVGKY